MIFIIKVTVLALNESFHDYPLATGIRLSWIIYQSNHVLSVSRYRGR